MYYLDPELEDQEGKDLKHVVAMGAHVFSKPADKRMGYENKRTICDLEVCEGLGKNIAW